MRQLFFPSCVVAAALVAALPSHALVLHDNGSPSTGPVASNGAIAPSGTTWSESRGGTIGWTSSATSSGTRFSLADDFSIAAGTIWTIDSINLLSYVYDVPVTQSPIRSVTLRIWSGTPGSADSTLVWGDYTTNRMTSSQFSDIYRAELGYADTSRPIWDNSVATDGLVLGSGSYWVDWTTSYSSGSGKSYGIPVYVDGLDAKPGSNGLQSMYDPATGATTWTPTVDTGVGAVQDLPFVIHGQIQAVPEPASVALFALGGGALMFWRRRRA